MIQGKNIKREKVKKYDVSGSALRQVWWSGMEKIYK